MVIALLFSSNFSKNFLSISLRKADEALLIIIVDFCSEIENCIILLINLTISKVYYLSDCN